MISFRLFLDFVLASVVLAMTHVTLIKKSHTLNCYSFLQKFLLKTKTYKLWKHDILLKWQIQKKLSTFCHFCLVQ